MKIKRGNLKGNTTGLKVFQRRRISPSVNRKRLWPMLSRAIGGLIKRPSSYVEMATVAFNDNRGEGVRYGEKTERDERETHTG